MGCGIHDVRACVCVVVCVYVFGICFKVDVGNGDWECVCFVEAMGRVL